MKTIIRIFLPVLIAGAGTCSSQVLLPATSPEAPGPAVFFDASDKIYVDEHSFAKRPVQLDYIRQANVSWEKRTWRTIDLREKQNQLLMFPLIPAQNRISLTDLIKMGLQAGELTLFRDNEFKFPLSREQALEKFYLKKYFPVFGPDGEKIKDTLMNVEITPDRIVQFRIKEDWYFEKERGVQEVRILGICPVYYDEEKEVYIEKGWIYFPQARNLLASHGAYNSRNDAAGISYDEFFHKRMFGSYIDKESNVFDREISQYAAGLDALLESEKIKGNIFQWENDLWHF